MKSPIKISSSISIVVALVLTVAAALTAQTDNHKTQQRPAVRPTVKLQPMNVKAGLWETTITYSTVGEMPIPASMLAKLTPEQRARMEQRMKANSSASSRTVTNQSCVTQEELEKAEFPESRDECTQTILTSTGSKAAGTISCELENVTVNGSLEIEAIDREHIKGSTHGTTTGGGRTRQVDTTFVSKWLEASCAKR